MRIETAFAISRPPAETYARLLELDAVAPCFPGAQLGGERPDGAREVTVTVRLGPMRLVYEGEVRIAERDDHEHRAVLGGHAREVRGAGSASATITMAVAATGQGSLVHAEAEIDLTGRAAQMGRGIIEDVARRLVADMAACLESSFTTLSEPRPGEAAAPAAGPKPRQEPALDGTRLLGAMARDRLRDPRVAAAAGAALMFLLGRVTRILGRRRHA